MNIDDMILISVDDHIVEPPNMFEGRLSARFQDRAPRVELNDDNSETWYFAGKRAAYPGLNAVAGRPPEEYGFEPTRFDDCRPGCYVVAERVKDMSANGVLASMNFPSFPRFCGQVFTNSAKDDPELSLAVLKAYNDWHIDEWCGSHPGRFIPLAILPLWDPRLMADELERVADKGCHAVTFSMNPYRLGLPSFHSDHWDPFWAAADAAGTVVNLHVGSGSYTVTTSPDAPMDVMMTCLGVGNYPTAADLVWSPVLRKFHNLTFSLSEGGIGWIPSFLERVDYTYSHHRAWTKQDFGDLMPSELFNSRVVTCFIDDRIGIENIRHLNEDLVTWESDYPHSDSTWPRSPETIWPYMEQLADDQINKITHKNAARVFQFDPFEHRLPEQCTVGALRHEVAGHDVSPVAHGVRENKGITEAQLMGVMQA